jgi:hypothetical protein
MIVKLTLNINFNWTQGKDKRFRLKEAKMVKISGGNAKV